MSGKRWHGYSTKCSRTRTATPGSTCSRVSKALLYALVAAAGNVLGALAVTRGAVRELRVIELLVAFGAGFMLSVAIVELLPAALARSGNVAPGLVLLGYLAVHLTQHTVTPHFHFGEETHQVSSVAGTSALVGLLLHTFFDGVAIASAFLVRPELGIMVFIAIFLHKLPEGVTISSLMLAGGRSGGRGGRWAGGARGGRGGVVRREEVAVRGGGGGEGDRGGGDEFQGVAVGAERQFQHAIRVGDGFCVGRCGKRHGGRAPAGAGIELADPSC